MELEGGSSPSRSRRRPRPSPLASNSSSQSQGCVDLPRFLPLTGLYLGRFVSKHHHQIFLRVDSRAATSGGLAADDNGDSGSPEDRFVIVVVQDETGPQPARLLRKAWLGFKDNPFPAPSAMGRPDEPMRGVVTFEVRWADVVGFDYLNPLLLDGSRVVFEVLRLAKRWFPDLEKCCEFYGWSTVRHEAETTPAPDDGCLSNRHDLSMGSAEDLEPPASPLPVRRASGAMRSSSSAEILTEIYQPAISSSPMARPFLGRVTCRSLTTAGDGGGRAAYAAGCTAHHPAKKMLLNTLLLAGERVVDKLRPRTRLVQDLLPEADRAAAMNEGLPRVQEECCGPEMMRDWTITITFDDPFLPYVLREVIHDPRHPHLLRLYESGMPAWAVFVPRYTGFYRRWMRILVSFLLIVVSVVSMLMGFYDLYTQVPIVRRLIRKFLWNPLVEHFDDFVSALYLPFSYFLPHVGSLRSLLATVGHIFSFSASWVRVTLAGVVYLCSDIAAPLKQLMRGLCGCVLWPCYNLSWLLFTSARTVHAWCKSWVAFVSVFAPLTNIVDIVRSTAWVLVGGFANLWIYLRTTLQVTWETLKLLSLWRIRSTSSIPVSPSGTISNFKNLWRRLIRMNRAFLSIYNFVLLLGTNLSKHRASIILFMIERTTKLYQYLASLAGALLRWLKCNVTWPILLVLLASLSGLCVCWDQWQAIEVLLCSTCDLLCPPERPHELEAFVRCTATWWVPCTSPDMRPSAHQPSVRVCSCQGGPVQEVALSWHGGQQVQWWLEAMKEAVNPKALVSGPPIAAACKQGVEIPTMSNSSTDRAVSLSKVWCRVEGRALRAVQLAADDGRRGPRWMRLWHAGDWSSVALELKLPSLKLRHRAGRPRWVGLCAEHREANATPQFRHRNPCHTWTSKLHTCRSDRGARLTADGDGLQFTWAPGARGSCAFLYWEVRLWISKWLPLQRGQDAAGTGTSEIVYRGHVRSVGTYSMRWTPALQHARYIRSSVIERCVDPHEDSEPRFSPWRIPPHRESGERLVVRGALDIEGPGVQVHMSSSSRIFVQEALRRTLSKPVATPDGSTPLIPSGERERISKLDLHMRRPCSTNEAPCQVVRLLFEAHFSCNWPQADGSRWDELYSKTQEVSSWDLPSQFASELKAGVCRTQQKVLMDKLTCHRFPRLCRWCAVGPRRWKVSQPQQHQTIEWFVQLAGSRCSSQSEGHSKIMYSALLGLAHALFRIYYFWCQKRQKAEHSETPFEEEEEEVVTPVQPQAEYVSQDDQNEETDDDGTEDDEANRKAEDADTDDERETQDDDCAGEDISCPAGPREMQDDDCAGEDISCPAGSCEMQDDNCATEKIACPIESSAASEHSGSGAALVEGESSAE